MLASFKRQAKTAMAERTADVQAHWTDLACLRGSMRRRSRVKTIKVQEIERVIYESIVSTALKILLQCAEIWTAVLAHRYDLAIQDELTSGEPRHARDNRRETTR